MVEKIKFHILTFGVPEIRSFFLLGKGEKIVCVAPVDKYF